MGKMIKCKNCGADIEENAAMCPYCGELNYKGAEKQYMEHLGDIKTSLEDLSSESTAEIMDEISNVGRTLKRSFIIIGIIILLFGGIYLFGIIAGVLGNNYYESLYGKSAYKDKVLWLSKYEAELNKMYADGQYEEIVEFKDEHYSDKGNGFSYWKHADFIELYSFYCEYLRLKDNSNLDDFVLGTMLCDVISIQTYKEGRYTDLSKEDMELLDKLGLEMDSFYMDYLGIQADEADRIKKEICYEHGNYYISSTTCAKYVEKYADK